MSSVKRVVDPAGVLSARQSRVDDAVPRLLDRRRVGAEDLELRRRGGGGCVAHERGHGDCQGKQHPCREPRACLPQVVPHRTLPVGGCLRRQENPTWRPRCQPAAAASVPTLRRPRRRPRTPRRTRPWRGTLPAACWHGWSARARLACIASSLSHISAWNPGLQRQRRDRGAEDRSSRASGRKWVYSGRHRRRRGRLCSRQYRLSAPCTSMNHTKIPTIGSPGCGTLGQIALVVGLSLVVLIALVYPFSGDLAIDPAPFRTGASPGSSIHSNETMPSRSRRAGIRGERGGRSLCRALQR